MSGGFFQLAAKDKGDDEGQGRYTQPPHPIAQHAEPDGEPDRLHPGLLNIDRGQGHQQHNRQQHMFGNAHHYPGGPHEQPAQRPVEQVAQHHRRENPKGHHQFGVHRVCGKPENRRAGVEAPDAFGGKDQENRSGIAGDAQT